MPVSTHSVATAAARPHPTVLGGNRGFLADSFSPCFHVFFTHLDVISFFLRKGCNRSTVLALWFVRAKCLCDTFPITHNDLKRVSAGTIRWDSDSDSK